MEENKRESFEILEEGFVNTGKDITKICVKEGTKAIGEFALYGFSNLKEIVLPSSLEDIREKAFWGCYSLQKIVIPDNVEHIGFSAFAKLSIKFSIPVTGPLIYTFSI